MTLEGFWESLREAEPPPYYANHGPCLLWQGLLNRKRGYGLLRNPETGKKTTAHRVAWMLAKGDIPIDLKVLHRCDTPTCCNPDHLWLGTDADNAADRDRKGRRTGAAVYNTAKTHCVNGHPLDAVNTYITFGGRRQCRRCKTEWAAAHRVRT